MNTKETYIGIDPDIDKSGVAIVHNNKMDLYNMKFYDLIDFILDNAAATFIIEDGEQNKALFNAYNATNKQIAAKIGTSIGKNFAVSKLLIELLEDNGYKYEIYKPTSKKLTNKEICNILNVKIRTNQEQRDAIRCILKYII